jgi:1-acyl-sn-glycerol-3-phosphate acyltransferase
VHFLVDWVFGYIPVLGSFVRLNEPIFVFNKKARFAWIDARNDRTATTTAWDECVARLKQDHSIGIFPEGTRNHDPETLLEGRSGIGKIVIDAEASVVPVGIDFRRRRTHGKIPFFGFVTLRIGDRMSFANEIEESRSIASSDDMPGPVRKRRLIYLQKTVLYKVMIELSQLSGKSYPFDAPVVPQ